MKNGEGMETEKGRLSASPDVRLQHAAVSKGGRVLQVHGQKIGGSGFGARRSRACGPACEGTRVAEGKGGTKMGGGRGWRALPLSSPPSPPPGMWGGAWISWSRGRQGAQPPNHQPTRTMPSGVTGAMASMKTARNQSDICDRAVRWAAGWWLVGRLGWALGRPRGFERRGQTTPPPPTHPLTPLPPPSPTQRA